MGWSFALASLRDLIRGTEYGVFGVETSLRQLHEMLRAGNEACEIRIVVIARGHGHGICRS
jgi:hypothetical protein